MDWESSSEKWTPLNGQSQKVTEKRVGIVEGLKMK